MVCDIVVTSAIKEATGEEYTALDLCSSVVSSIGTALMPTVILEGIVAGIVEVANCATQKQSLVESVSSVSSAVVGTVVTMNNVHEYLTGVKFDDVSKLINDLVYGSIEYIGLTASEVFISSLTNTNSTGTKNSSSKPLHELVNFKKIPLPEIKKTGYGFCPR